MNLLHFARGCYFSAHYNEIYSAYCFNSASRFIRAYTAEICKFFRISEKSQQQHHNILFPWCAFLEILYILLHDFDNLLKSIGFSHDLI